MSKKRKLQTMIADCQKLTHQISKVESTLDELKDGKKELTKRIKDLLELDTKSKPSVIVNIEGKPFLVLLTGTTYSEELNFVPLSELENIEGTIEFNYISENKKREKDPKLESFFDDLTEIRDIEVSKELKDTKALLSELMDKD